MPNPITLNNVKISLRKDTLSAWEKVNPVLNNGEMAIAEDNDGNQFLKIGNGISSFNQLPYVGQNQIRTNSVIASSISQGFKADGSSTSTAGGIYVEAPGNFQHVYGIEAAAAVSDDYAFVWNGKNLDSITDRYVSHGKGTFSVNPADGLSGVYVGERSLAESFSQVLYRRWVSSDVNI